jgi:hypothetical protein
MKREIDSCRSNANGNHAALHVVQVGKSLPVVGHVLLAWLVYMAWSLTPKAWVRRQHGWCRL